MGFNRVVQETAVCRLTQLSNQQTHKLAKNQHYILAPAMLVGCGVTRSVKAGGLVLLLLVACLGVAAMVQPRLARNYAKRAYRWASRQLLHREPRSRMDDLPKVVFWAWERPEDLRFLSTPSYGVAFLAKTIYLRPARGNPSDDLAANVVVRPRLQPLRVVPKTPLIAVVRIETSLPWPAPEKQSATLPIHNKNKKSSAKGTTPSVTAPTPVSPLGLFTPHQLEETAQLVADLRSLDGVRAIQIDFDAKTNEHAFYAALLQAVRGKLPNDIPLSITALASWCIGDPWLSQLPPGTIDEAVPMLFRMGPDAANVSRFLQSGENFHVAACQSSLGLSTDEEISRGILGGAVQASSSDRGAKRIYLFAPRAWDETSSLEIRKDLPSWHAN